MTSPGVNIATAYLQIIPTVKGLQGHLGRAISDADGEINSQGKRQGGVFAGAFGKAFALAGAVGGAAAVGGFFKGAIDQASDLQESGTKLQAVFGTATGDIETFAARGAKALGQSNLAVKDAAATFGVYGKAAGLADKDNAAFASNLAGLSTDLASFYNADPSQVIEAIGSGLRGEAEPLRQFGVLLDDATLREEALAQGLIKTTKEALTPQQKVLAAQAVIMKQTSIAQGDFERTSGGLANQQRILGAQWTDMKGRLGQAFLPGVVAVVSGLNEKLFPALEQVGAKVTVFKDAFAASDTFAAAKEAMGGLYESARILATGDYRGPDSLFGLEEDSKLVDFLFDVREGLGGAYEAARILVTGDFRGGLFGLEEDSGLAMFLYGVRDAAIEVAKIVGGAFLGTWREVWPVLKEVGLVVGQSLVKVFEALWPAVESLIPVVAQLLPLLNPVTLIFKALLPILPDLARMVGELAALLADALGQALQALAPVFMTVVQVVGQLLPVIATLIGSLLPPLAGLFASIAPLLSTVLAAVIPLIERLAAGLIPVIEALLPVFERVFVFIADSLGNFIQIATGVINFFLGVFTGDWSKVWEGIKGIFGGIWDQIVNILGTALDLFIQFFTELGPRIWDTIVSISQTVLGWGNQFLQWLWDGIVALAPQVMDWFYTLPGRLWEFIVGVWRNVSQWGRDLLTWVWDGIKAVAVDVWNWFWNLPGTLWNFVSGKWEEFVGWGRGIVNRLWEGAKNTVQTLKDWVWNLPGALWEFAKGKWGDFVQWGKDLVAGIVEGIKAAPSIIWDAITGLVTGDINASDPSAGTGLIINQPGVVGGGTSRGGVVPGRDPGRRDNVLGRLPNGVGWGLRSEEAVMVPEFTRTVGVGGVHRLNRAAEQGRLGDFFPGFARGGVVGDMKAFGKSLITEEFKPLIDLLRGAAQQVSASMSGAGGFSAAGGSWGPENYSGNAANTQAAIDYVRATWPRVNPIYGFGGGSVSTSDHPKGKAADFMIPGWNTSAGLALGNEVANFFLNNPNRFGTKYLIWQKKFNDLDGNGWTNYSHPGGSNPTLDHFDHVHASFLTGPSPVGGGFAPAPESGAILAGVNGGKFPPLVERWRPLGTDVLGKVGNYKKLPLVQHVDRMLNQIRTESGGDPNAINNYDINAQRGDPSIGLLQVIGATFRSALTGTPFANLIGLGQRDPRASITASTLYSLNRYGDLAKAWRGVAYDEGGWLAPGGRGMNLLNKPEPVLTPSQWATAERAMAYTVELKDKDRAGVTFTGDIHLGQGSTPADLFDEALWKAKTGLGV